MKYFFKSLKTRILPLLLLSISVFISCNKSNNVWKISGTIENYSAQPVFISIRGQFDSTHTDAQGNFEFVKTNQYSDFVRISLSRTQHSVLHLFADSICKIQVHVKDTAHMQQALIQNSPESVLLQDLYTWYYQNKQAFDSTVQAFKRERAETNNPDSLRILYISKLDELHMNHVAFLQSFITKNAHSPIATTASFMSFDTIRYTPILLREQGSVKMYKDILHNINNIYGPIPFVELYAKSVRAIEMSLEYEPQ